MQFPLQITFRNMPSSEAIEANIREKAEKLQRYYSHILNCNIVVEAPHRHHHKGKIYHVRIDINVPNKELVVSRDPHQNHAHEDVYVAIRDAFEAARKQLESFAAKQRGEIKTHETPHSIGQIIAVLEGQDHGFIRTQEGREIYFHKNSVLSSAFSELEPGSVVKFIEHTGEKGPQASSVSLLNKA